MGVFEIHFEDVAKTARYLGVSEQRVRKLLQQRRIAGRKAADGTGPWQVEFPPVIRGGMRGPRLRFHKAKSAKV